MGDNASAVVFDCVSQGRAFIFGGTCSGFAEKLTGFTVSNGFVAAYPKIFDAYNARVSITWIVVAGTQEAAR